MVCPTCLLPFALQPEAPQSCSPVVVRKAVAAASSKSLSKLAKWQQFVPLLAYCLSDINIGAGTAYKSLKLNVALSLVLGLN